MGRIDGKVALVAGAGGGIGGAGAEGLAREGAAVACTDIDGAAAEIIAARIRAADRRVSPEQSAAALSAAPAEAQRPCSGGSRVLAVAVNRLWRKFNDNLLGRF
jgi:3-oxoacyl-[acyl-carrier protein] reductase